MTKRGRASTNDLSLVVDITRAPPPEPPRELPPTQAAIWRDIFGAIPSGYVPRASYSVAISLCRHIDRECTLAQMVETFRPEWAQTDEGLQRLNKLLSMAERESRAVAARARSLRLTPQSVHQPVTASRKLTAHRPAGVSRPWDVKE
jgi:hypothetical protein